VASPEDPATVHADSHVDGAASHDDHGGGHSDPFSFVLIELAVVVILAIIGRWLAGRFNQAAVLGELMIGVIVGNIGYWLGKPLFVLIMHISDADQIIHAVWSSGASVHDAARQAFPEATMGPESIVGQLVNIMTGPAGGNYILMSSALWMFSSLGVILLLFMVGLESSVGEMLKVGGRATAVAIVGIIAPFGLGYVTCLWLLPDAGTPAHLFMSATLCATSVGITARVFKDLGTMQRPEAKVILGAAVIDDILGLIILAIVVGVVKSGEVKGDEIMKISLMSAVFLGAVILVGERFARGAARVMGVLDRDNNKLLFPLALACFLSWAANQIELATIVGAFAAGLILNEKHFEEHAKSTTVEELIAPLERIFAPVFFVLMGMQVNLASFVDPGTIKLAAIFSVVAIIGKVVCGLPAGKDMDRLSIGIGMVPRGEVGLIFASIGRSMGVVNDEVFSAIVVVVMVSTLITPPAMKWSMQRTA
jgi:Kef-type K+ transport system membrane component KefB